MFRITTVFADASHREVDYFTTHEEILEYISKDLKSSVASPIISFHIAEI